MRAAVSAKRLPQVNVASAISTGGHDADHSSSASSARDLSRADWYMVLACYKLGIILEGTYARACAGKAPKETGDMLHDSTISLFERALRKIA